MFTILTTFRLLEGSMGLPSVLPQSHRNESYITPSAEEECSTVVTLTRVSAWYLDSHLWGSFFSCSLAWQILRDRFTVPACCPKGMLALHILTCHMTVVLHDGMLTTHYRFHYLSNICCLTCSIFWLTYVVGQYIHTSHVAADILIWQLLQGQVQYKVPIYIIPFIFYTFICVTQFVTVFLSTILWT